MTDIRSSAPIPMGIAVASVFALLVFTLDNGVLNTLVFSTYYGLVDSSTYATFFEVAWLLATFDRLLDLTSLLSILLWLCVILLGVLVFRQPNNSIKMTLTAPLLYGGAWFIFAYKYASVAAFTLPIFLFFLLYRFLITLGVIAFGTLTLCFPFWLANRRHTDPVRVSEGVQSICKKCGAAYRSNPLVCIECGEEREIPE